MPPIVGKVQGIAGVVAALLLPAYVSAFVTPGAGRCTALAGDKGGASISRCNASPDAATPSAPVAATAKDAKDKLKDVLAANRGSTLEPDVFAAAEVSKYQAFFADSGLVCLLVFVRQPFGKAPCHARRQSLATCADSYPLLVSLSATNLESARAKMADE